MSRANPRLNALKSRVLAERRRRGDEGYVDDHVKRIAVHLVIEEIELADLSPAASFVVANAVGLSVADYIAAISWLDPDHAALLRQHSN
ncbi:MAG TPA: hypothetical protein VJ738_01295 [Steroidobacteraceae bacterium]|nr:hypothetical protein [Steroidobacteraceae bacterium]